MGTRLASLPRRPTRLWIGLGAAAAAVLLVAAAVSWWNGPDGGTAKTDGGVPTALPARTVSAGPVTVKLEPRQLDAAGAAFEISFDTHSEALDLDVARSSTLVVGGTAWPVIGWSGDGPGGHHREGNLRFSAGGPATGRATLTVTGLSKPVSATWDVEG